MYNGKKFLGLIPARGGSKGLPGKNIKIFLDKPLIAWTIEQAKWSKYLDEILVSTDSEEIAKIARQFGASVPFMRPSALAQDNSPTADTVVYTINKYKENGMSFDYIVLLEPTSPLRKMDDIDNALKLITNSPEADCLVSVGGVHLEHPIFIKRVSETGFLIPYFEFEKKIHQRQQADLAYFPYGVVYISRVTTFINNPTFYSEKTLPYFIERWQNYEIDDEIDFFVVENLAKFKMR